MASLVCNGKVTWRVRARFGLNVLFTGTNLNQHIAVYVKFNFFFFTTKAKRQNSLLSLNAVNVFKGYKECVLKVKAGWLCWHGALCFLKARLRTQTTSSSIVFKFHSYVLIGFILSII